VHKYNRVFNFIAVIIFIVFFWVVAIFLMFSLSSSKDPLKNLLPNDVEVVISVNTDQLIKSFLVDALYRSEFSANELKLLEKGRNSQEVQSFGIEVNSELVMFYDLWNKIPIQGFLFNISNEKDFNGLRLKSKNDIKRSNGKQGVILLISDNATEEMIAYFTEFADNIISKKVKHMEYGSKPEMFSLDYKGNQNTYITDLKLNAKIDEERILLKGSGKKNDALSFSVKDYNMLTEPSTTKYLEFQSGQLPDSLYQYFEFVFEEIGIEIPKITSQQMLLYGLSIENIRGSTTVLPKFDWILRFDSIIDLDSQLVSINTSTDMMKIIDKKSIKIGETLYYYSQISSHEIYIGVTESPKIKSIKTQVLPLLKGNPSVLLEIEGKGLIAQLINVMPQVKNTRVFMENIEYFNIHTSDDNGANLKIDGEIRLKEGKMMTIELARFLLMFMK